MIIPLESRATVQLPFPGKWDTLPKVHIVEFGIEIGMTTSEVFTAILRLHPDIKHFSYIVFDPDKCSNIEPDSQRWSLDDEVVTWVPTTGLDVASLEALSLSVIEKTREKIDSWITDDEDDETNIGFDIPAITSTVEMEDGSIVDIPMLDFNVDKSDEAVEKIATYLQGTPGVLLETDQSYHFWGVILLQNSEWYSFLERHLPDYYHFLNKIYRPQSVSFDKEYALCRQLRQLAERSRISVIDSLPIANLEPLIGILSENDQIVDANYLKTSLCRKYSALRFLGYPDTSKTMTPRVVRIIK